MWKSKSALVAAVLWLQLSLVNGQDLFPGVGTCGRTCSTNALGRFSQYGCTSATDISCLCTKNDFLFSLRDCVNQGCPANEQAGDIAAFGKTCPGKEGVFSSASSAPASTQSSASNVASVATTATSNAAPGTTAVGSSSIPATSNAAPVSSSSSAAPQSQSSSQNPASSAPAGVGTGPDGTQSAFTTYTTTGIVPLSIFSTFTTPVPFTYTLTSTITNPTEYSSLLQAQQLAGSTASSANAADPSATAASSSESSSSDSGLSTGAKAGIGVGVALGAILAAVALFFLLRKRKSGGAPVDREKHNGSDLEERPVEFASFPYEKSR